jgi:hypothetical protein
MKCQPCTPGQLHCNFLRRGGERGRGSKRLRVRTVCWLAERCMFSGLAPCHAVMGGLLLSFDFIHRCRPQRHRWRFTAFCSADEGSRRSGTRWDTNEAVDLYGELYIDPASGVLV